MANGAGGKHPRSRIQPASGRMAAMRAWRRVAVGLGMGFMASTVAQAREAVSFPSPYGPGTIVISQSARKLFLVTGPQSAIAYPVAVVIVNPDLDRTPLLDDPHRLPVLLDVDEHRVGAVFDRLQGGRGDRCPGADLPARPGELAVPVEERQQVHSEVEETRGDRQNEVRAALLRLLHVHHDQAVGHDASGEEKRSADGQREEGDGNDRKDFRGFCHGIPL